MTIDQWIAYAAPNTACVNDFSPFRWNDLGVARLVAARPYTLKLPSLTLKNLWEVDL